MTTIAMESTMQVGATIISLMNELRRDVRAKRARISESSTHESDRDEYDTPDAKYVVSGAHSERLAPCPRLLPTMGEYMLPNLFPQLLGGRMAPRSSTLWELSRFSLSVNETVEGRALSLSRSTLESLDDVIDFARLHGIGRLILVATVGIERLLLRADVAAHRIAPPARVDGNLCVALYIDVPSGATAADANRGDALQPAD